MKKYAFDSHKLIYHMDRVYDHYEHGERIAPLHIDIGATKMCNARCTFCYGTYQEMTKDMVPRVPLVNLFRDAPRLGVRSLAVTGDGEPTLNPSIYDACFIGYQGGLSIGLATNGIALSEDKIRALVSTCTWLRFNVSGVGEDYKTVMGVPQWKRVQGNIRTAVRAKKEMGARCDIGLQMVLVPWALGSVVPEAEFATGEGVDYFVIKQYSDPGDSRLPRVPKGWYKGPAVMNVLQAAEAMSTDRTSVVPKYKTMRTGGKRRYDRCVDCPLLFQVSGNGRCYPCGYLFNHERYCYGDLKRQSLEEILDSERYWEIVRFMRNGFDTHTMCEGNCRHDATNAFMWNYLRKPRHVNFI